MKTGRRAAALDALASPVRQELMSQLGDGPTTVQILAQRLGRSRQALYYHLVTLERAGLIRVAGTHGDGRDAERVYAVAAPPPATRSAGAFTRREREAATRAVSAMLRLTQREVTAASERVLGEGPTERTPLIVIRAKARLDAAALTRVRALLQDLTGIFRAAKGKHLDERLFALTMVLTPSRESVTTPRRRAPRGHR